jgi:SAM-dependent methyltransferase
VLFEELFSAEERHGWFRARNQIIAAVLRWATASLPPGYTALEIGCGTGNVLRVLNESHGAGKVVAIDRSFGGFRYARQRAPQSALVQADMHRAPFKIRFDLIGMFDVIEHLADDVGALRDVTRLLRPGGKLVLTVPAHMGLWSYADEFAGHYRRYARRELTEKLARAGLRVEYLTHCMVCLFPIMWVQRRLAAWIHGRGREPRELFFAELRPVPMFNEMLRWILTKEALAVGVRLVLPFGTSLLAVAARDPGVE